MRVVIVGVGGVGAVIGAHLAQAGHSVGFVARGAQLQTMRTHGLRVSWPTGEVFLAKPEVSDTPAELGAADVVWLCTKLYDLADAVRACRPLLRAGTLVVPIQNGVEADQIVRAQPVRGLGQAQVLPGLVYTTSASVSPGVVRQSSEIFRLAFGARDGARSAAAQALEAACREAGLDATLADDIGARLWAKLTFLSSVNALMCLGRLDIGGLRSAAGARALLVEAMREVIAVAAGQGVELKSDLVERSLELLDALPEDSTSSMHADLIAGRRLEIEWLSGAVVRLGRAGGVETPIHRVALDLLSPHAAGVKRGARAAPRPLPDGYRFSQRHADQQLDVIHDFLTHSYWSPGIARERVERAVANSLVVGAFDAGGRQVGFARMITDHVSFGYLADVFVLDAHRERGLASAMVRSLMELPEVQGMRTLLLATRDAHSVYARLGWSPLANPARWMEV